MSLPTLIKTWQFNVNQSTVATGLNSTTSRNCMFVVKQSLIGFAIAAWSVVSSSNSLAAGAGDKWLSSANIIGATAGTIHSWIVLQQTGIATNFQLCIDMSNANMGSATIVISPSAGFVTGGTTTNRPTAADEIVLINNAAWGALGSAGAADNNCVTHALQSSDGQCTRIFFAAQSKNTGFWQFEVPNNANSSWVNPSISTALSGVADQATVANLCGAGVTHGKGASTMVLFYGIEGGTAGLDTALFTSANDLDGALPMFYIGVGSLTTANRGRHGSIYDCWFGITSIGITGDTIPVGTPQFAWFGNMIVPWNGTVPIIA